MLEEAGVRVYYRHRLKEEGGVRKEGTQVTAITMENGATFEGRIFADCTYEGDLMAKSGVSYTWGREGVDQYGESLAGVRDRTPKHQFTVSVNPYDKAGKLLPYVQGKLTDKPGSADKKVQAYNFRIIATRDPRNRVPWPKPRSYHPQHYELLARLLEALEKQLGRSPVMSEVMKPDHLPNHKADINNNGAFSTDHIGGSWEYPDASYQRKAEIWRDHVDYVQGFFYFLSDAP